MREAISQNEIAGAVTVVVGKDKVLHLECTGFADVAPKKPMTADTLFWIASMTKPITGTAILMLQDEGKLNVTDPVAKYLPEFAKLLTPSGKPANLTLAQILTHTSGLGEARGPEEPKAKTLADLVPLWLAAPMQYEPGAKWQYTQSGINAAGRIVEVVSGMSFDAFLQRRLFDPLGMTNTTFYLTDDQRVRLVTAYAKNKETGMLEPVPPRADERAFSKHIEPSAFLIDFGELGELVCEKSSGFLTREDVVTRVSMMPETVEAIKALKQDLRSNYQKLFKESFADKEFKDKWKQFETLRNKIAHNNLFTSDDLNAGERLAKEITEIISAAGAEAEKLIITTEERVAIKEQVVAKAASWQSTELTEAAFFEALDRTQALFATREDGFVGLTYFVNEFLIPERFSYVRSRSMIDHLSKTGQIEVYSVQHPTDPAKRTAAIRRPLLPKEG